MGVWCAAAGASRRGFVAHHRGPVRALCAAPPRPTVRLALRPCLPWPSWPWCVVVWCHGCVGCAASGGVAVLHPRQGRCCTGCGRGCDVMMGLIACGVAPASPRHPCTSSGGVSGACQGAGSISLWRRFPAAVSHRPRWFPRGPGNWCGDGVPGLGAPRAHRGVVVVVSACRGRRRVPPRCRWKVTSWWSTAWLCDGCVALGHGDRWCHMCRDGEQCSHFRCSPCRCRWWRALRSHARRAWRAVAGRLLWCRRLNRLWCLGGVGAPPRRCRVVR